MSHAELIPAVRLIDWTPGVYTGVNEGIPTNYTIYKNAVTEGVPNNGVDDAAAGINALITACPVGQFVYLPAGRYKISSDSIRMKTGVLLRGAGADSTTGTRILNYRGDRCISMGPTNGFIIPAGATLANMTVSGGATCDPTNGGLAKGCDKLTIGSTATLSVDQMVAILEDIDDDVPHVSVFAFRNRTRQIVRITAKTATRITFFPELYDSYGAGAVPVIINAPAEQIEDSGVEDLYIDMTAAGENGIDMNQALNCWIKGVTVHEARNYPFKLDDNLNCEVRRCISKPRNGSGTSGAGIIMARCSGMLIEDNISYDNWIAEFMINDGSSGNLISRNFCTSPHFIDTNHAPNNQFNLYEANSASGFKSDGYFGGERYLTIFRNKTRFTSLYRFNRNSNLVGNVYTTGGAGTNVYGYPNFGNALSEGTATWYPGNHSDDWRDRDVTAEITTITKGTGTGYLINKSGGYVCNPPVDSTDCGRTTIAVDTGSGTILAEDRVSFAGSPIRYRVTAFSSGTITIAENSLGSTGLLTSVADNAAVTVSSDYGTMTTVGGGFADNTPYPLMDVMLTWDSFGTYQLCRTSTVAGDVVTILPTSTINTPNITGLPNVGTDLVIGMGQGGPNPDVPGSGAFQEIDLGVEATLVKKGNRYSDSSFDSLGGDTAPDSLAYDEKPAWMIAAQTEFSTTFNLRAYNAEDNVPPSDSDIPAGYRYTFTLPPEHTTASIDATGTILTIGANKPMFVGAGGSVDAILVGGVTCTFDHISGSNMIFTPSRTIIEAETLTVSLDNVTNGFEDVNGNDLPDFSGLSVSNASSATTGVEHYGPTFESTDTDFPYGDSNYTFLQPTTVSAAGTALGVRFYVKANTTNALARVTITDGSRNVLSSGTGTVTGSERWMFIPSTSFHVTAGTYMGTVQFLGNGDPVLRTQASQPSGSSYLVTNVAFGDSLPASFSPVTNLTYKIAIQIRVATDEDAPVNTVIPAITGAPTEGITLTGSNGTWTGSPTFTRQWERCATAEIACEEISGATSATYMLATDDVNKFVRIRVTGTNGQGSADAYSNLTAQVQPAPVPGSPILRIFVQP